LLRIERVWSRSASYKRVSWTNRAAVFDQPDLAPHFEIDRRLQELETVEVLDLDPGAEFCRAAPAHADVGSHRKLPSCMLPSQMPSQTTSACSARA